MSPDAVQDVSIRKYPDVKIRSQNLVKSRDFLVSKECIWHPDFARVSERQIPNFIWKRLLTPFTSQNNWINLSNSVVLYPQTSAVCHSNVVSK